MGKVVFRTEFGSRTTWLDARTREVKETRFSLNPDETLTAWKAETGSSIMLVSVSAPTYRDVTSDLDKVQGAIVVQHDWTVAVVAEVPDRPAPRTQDAIAKDGTRLEGSPLRPRPPEERAEAQRTYTQEQVIEMLRAQQASQAGLPFQAAPADQTIPDTAGQMTQ